MTATRINARFGLLALCAALPAAALGNQALVRAYDRPELEIGQAYLTHYAGQCLALLPKHVVDETGVPAFLREGDTPLLGEAAGVTDLGDDLAIAEVNGAITTDCGFSMSTISRAVDRRIQDNGLAVIRSVNGDGTIAQLAVTIIDDDGRNLLRVQPTNADNPMRKGHSGSLLMIGKAPVGMLLSVHARSGVGTVLRLDRMLEKAEGHVSGAAALTPSAAAGRERPSAEPPAQVVGWNVMPVNAAHRAVNLTAADASAAWFAEVPDWPAEIELDLGGARRVVSALELDGTQVPEPGALPAQAEVFINVSESKKHWRSITAGELQFSEGRAHISFAPVWARQIRIVFGAAADGGQRIALRRIGIKGP
ncbi:MAG: hypothetical protein J5I92_01410 [Thiogranum sp.]|nr:hypothetical protein [Thiogranum sp.]